MKVESGKEYVTRDDREVLIFTTESPHAEFQVVGAVKDGDRWNHTQWHENGTFRSDEKEHELDLRPKPQKKLWYLALPPLGGFSHFEWRDSRESAEATGRPVANILVGHFTGAKLIEAHVWAKEESSNEL